MRHQSARESSSSIRWVLIAHMMLLSAVTAAPAGFSGTADVSAAAGTGGTVDALGLAVREAVRKVDPSIVRVRVIGGELTVDGDRVSSLTTTGIVVSAAGEILTSRFALQGRPESILVEDLHGNRMNAIVVATDEVRQLVLLRAGSGNWQPAVPAQPDNVHPGQWAIAAGRFYSASSSGVSVGIVSARNRIHGMAIQTDAKISPVNYGGPLINLRGEVMGILVPLSPKGSGNASAGIEWYDSGIGFAIPLADALQVTERLRSGNDLKPGRLGVKLGTSGLFSSTIRVERVVPGGPADVAGLRKGDLLLAVNNRDLQRISILEEAVSRAYAGDILNLSVRRGEESTAVEITLTESLPQPTFGYLGIMTIRSLPATPPAREANADNPNPPPAEKADHLPVIPLNQDLGTEGAQPGRIELVSVNGSSTTSVAEFRSAISDVPVGSVVTVEYRTPGTEKIFSGQITASTRPDVLTPIPNSILTLLHVTPPSAADRRPEAENRIASVNDVTRREHDFEGLGRAVSFSPTTTTGLLPGVVILLASHDNSEENVLKNWRPLLQSHGLIVVIPGNPENTPLTIDDAPLVMQALRGVAAGGKADLRRIVVVADRERQALAWHLTHDGPSPIRGVALTDGWPLSGRFNSIDGSDHSVLLLDPAAGEQSRALLQEARQQLSQAGFWGVRPADQSAERNIADWSLYLQSY